MSRAHYIILLTLSGLVILTVLAILGANLGFFPGAETSSLAKWGPAGALAEIIALYVFVGKAVFGTRPSGKPSLVIGPPERPASIRDFDIRRIQWAHDKCFVVYGENKRRPIKLVRHRTGDGFRVLLPDGLLEAIGNEDVLELELKDTKGNRWYVEPFLPNENLLRLSVGEDVKKIIAEYAVEDE